jgi:hypothetical protein
VAAKRTEVKRQILAGYLACVAIGQLWIYTKLVAGDAPFYLDPRIGLSLLEGLAHEQGGDPGVMSWISLAWLAGMAVAIGRQARGCASIAGLRLFSLS